MSVVGISTRRHVNVHSFTGPRAAAARASAAGACNAIAFAIQRAFVANRAMLTFLVGINDASTRRATRSPFVARS